MEGNKWIPIDVFFMASGSTAEVPKGIERRLKRMGYKINPEILERHERENGNYYDKRHWGK